MWKIFGAGLTVLLMAVSSSLLAQQAPAPTPAATQPAVPASVRAPWTAEDTAAFSDARIAALKAGLELRPDQEKAWNSFEAAFRDFAKQQTDRITQSRSTPPEADLIALMRRRADAMSAAALALKQLADITEPLYGRLDDSQKRRMLALTTGPGR